MQPGTVQAKVEELAAALKNAGWWMNEEPAWVRDYQSETEKPDVDFFEWLQFVYLPNRLMNRAKEGSRNQLITMQVKKYATDALLDQRIVRLLVELDAL